MFISYIINKYITALSRKLQCGSQYIQSYNTFQVLKIKYIIYIIHNNVLYVLDIDYRLENKFKFTAVYAV